MVRRWGPLILGIVVLGFLLTRVDLARVIGLLVKVNIPYLLLASMLALSATALKAMRFAPFGSRSRAFLWLYGCFALMRGLTVIMPFRTGEVASLALLKHHGFVPSIAHVVPIWALLRAWDILALASCSGLILVAGALGAPTASQPTALLVVYLGVALFCVAAVAFVVVQHLDIPTTSTWIGRRLTALKEGTRMALAQHHFTRTAILSCAIWAAMIMATVGVQHALYSPLTIGKSILASVLVLSLSLLPIHAPAGVGTGDAVWTGVLAGFGLSLEVAVALAVSIRLVLLGLITLDTTIGYGICALFRPMQ